MPCRPCRPCRLCCDWKSPASQAHRHRLGLAICNLIMLITSYNRHNIKSELLICTCCPHPDPVRPDTGDDRGPGGSKKRDSFSGQRQLGRPAGPVDTRNATILLRRYGWLRESKEHLFLDSLTLHPYSLNCESIHSANNHEQIWSTRFCKSV